MLQDLRQKCPRPVAARLGEKVGRRRVLDDLAVVHEHDAADYLAGEAYLVGDDAWPGTTPMQISTTA